MKRLILALLVMSLSAPAAGEWVKVGETNDGSFFIDPETIRSNGHFRKVWLITNMKKLVVEGARSYRVQWEYDCKEERSRVLYVIGHSREMAGGERLFAGSGPQKWEATPPDTPDALVREIVCASGYSLRYFNTSL
ncbi:MAG TPA: surface-adhesin E family protein [Thiobacillaceae bacterium]